MTGSLPSVAGPGWSRLLDLRECAGEDFAAIHREMIEISLRQQPAWFRPLLRRSRRLRSATGHDHWSRAWEYPWAILAAQLGEAPLRIADVGGGGSAFAPYLARRGHRCAVVDPSLNEGAGCVYDRRRTLLQNARSMTKKVLFRAAGIHSVWGLPASGTDRQGIEYFPYLAEDLGFEDGHFDRVFCLSVIEHIPPERWAGCMKELARVVRPGGRLILTEDMTSEEANREVYRKLVECCPLRLAGDPRYPVPLDPADQQRRHPGQGYETIGLVWLK